MMFNTEKMEFENIKFFGGDSSKTYEAVIKTVIGDIDFRRVRIKNIHSTFLEVCYSNVQFLKIEDAIVQEVVEVFEMDKTNGDVGVHAYIKQVEDIPVGKRLRYIEENIGARIEVLNKFYRNATTKLNINIDNKLSSLVAEVCKSDSDFDAKFKILLFKDNTLKDWLPGVKYLEVCEGKYILGHGSCVRFGSYNVLYNIATESIKNVKTSLYRYMGEGKFLEVDRGNEVPFLRGIFKSTAMDMFLVTKSNQDIGRFKLEVFDQNDMQISIFFDEINLEYEKYSKEFEKVEIFEIFNESFLKDVKGIEIKRRDKVEYYKASNGITNLQEDIYIGLQHFLNDDPSIYLIPRISFNNSYNLMSVDEKSKYVGGFKELYFDIDIESSNLKIVNCDNNFEELVEFSTLKYNLDRVVNDTSARMSNGRVDNLYLYNENLKNEILKSSGVLIPEVMEYLLWENVEKSFLISSNGDKRANEAIEKVFNNEVIQKKDGININLDSCYENYKIKYAQCNSQKVDYGRYYKLKEEKDIFSVKNCINMFYDGDGVAFCESFKEAESSSLIAILENHIEYLKITKPTKNKYIQNKGYLILVEGYKKLLSELKEYVNYEGLDNDILEDIIILEDECGVLTD